MSRLKHVAFEDVAGDLAALLESVRAEQTSIVVEYASGEQLLIKPRAAKPRRSRKEQSQEAAPSADPRSRQQPAHQGVATDNISSVGAVYELDPDSVTPG